LTSVETFARPRSFLALSSYFGVLEVVPVEGVAVEVRRAHDRQVVVVLVTVALVGHGRGRGHRDERDGRSQDSEPPDAARGGDAHTDDPPERSGGAQEPCRSMLGPVAPDGKMPGSSDSVFSHGSPHRRVPGAALGSN
jgi:hypothetical protein